MRLVLIHGINNENNSATDIEDIWMKALRDAWKRDGLAGPHNLQVTTAYYADELARLSNASRGAIPAGTVTPPHEVEMALLQEYANAAGVGREQIAIAAQEEGVDLSIVEAGAPHKGWIIALARALENTLPTRGRYLAGKFIKQASVYIERRGVQSIIKKIVRSQIFGDSSPLVIVAHSLGTVVCYELLLEATTRVAEVPLFCTLGSPMGVRIVCEYLGARSEFPRPPIGKWINGLHREDFVALGRMLGKANIGFEGIENDNTIASNEEDKHDIRAYLSAPSISSAIHAALVS
jgi:hypothetical protein